MRGFHEIAAGIHYWLRAGNVPDIDGVEVQISFPTILSAWSAKAALCSEMLPYARDLREETSIRAALSQPFKFHGLTFRFVIAEKATETLRRPSSPPDHRSGRTDPPRSVTSRGS